MSFAILETVYQVIDEHGTHYRLRPNPDTDDGFKSGAYIGWWDDTPETADKNELFVSPSALRQLARAFELAADDAENVI